VDGRGKDLIRSPLKRSTGEARASVKVARCKAPKCRNPAIPYRKHCGPDCGAVLGLLAIEKAKRIEAKRERAEDKAKREKLKSLSDLANDAQEEVNRYVRLRDRHLGCISCDKGQNWHGQWHAGHLRSRGACSSTRFILFNLAKQCSECNTKRGGNGAVMRPAMEDRFGKDKIDWVFRQPRESRWNREHLIRLKLVFRKKANREARKERSCAQ
jgi:hypothetical protein